jgi:hypothetical protein
MVENNAKAGRSGNIPKPSVYSSVCVSGDVSWKIKRGGEDVGLGS